MSCRPSHSATTPGCPSADHLEIQKATTRRRRHPNYLVFNCVAPKEYPAGVLAPHGLFRRGVHLCAGYVPPSSPTPGAKQLCCEGRASLVLACQEERHQFRLFLFKALNQSPEPPQDSPRSWPIRNETLYTRLRWYRWSKRALLVSHSLLDHLP
jgi:hypothetical protein